VVEAISGERQGGSGGRRRRSRQPWCAATWYWLEVEAAAASGLGADRGDGRESRRPWCAPALLRHALVCFFSCSERECASSSWNGPLDGFLVVQRTADMWPDAVRRAFNTLDEQQQVN
jgi:hypothetical protein